MAKSGASAAQGFQGRLQVGPSSFPIKTPTGDWALPAVSPHPGFSPPTSGRCFSPRLPADERPRGEVGGAPPRRRRSRTGLLGCRGLGTRPPGRGSATVALGAGSGVEQSRRPARPRRLCQAPPRPAVYRKPTAPQTERGGNRTLQPGSRGTEAWPRVARPELGLAVPQAGPQPRAAQWSSGLPRSGMPSGTLPPALSPSP